MTADTKTEDREWDTEPGVERDIEEVYVYIRLTEGCGDGSGYAARLAMDRLARRLRQSDPGGREWWNCPTCEREGDGSVISPPDALHCPMCGTRNPAAPTDEAPEGTVYATISCENPECESRGQEPHKLHDGDPMDYCQVCCEETLTLRLHTPPPVEEGERGGGLVDLPDV